MRESGTALLLALTGLLSAAPASGAGIQLGVQAGLNLARSTYELEGALTSDEVDDKADAGAIGGVVLSVVPSGGGAWTVDTGVFVEKRGGTTAIPVQTSPGGGTGPVDVMWRFTCLTVPASVKARLGHGSARPYARLGGEVVFPLTAERESTSPGGTTTVTEMKDEVTTANFGLLGALGIEFPLASVTGTTEVSYRHGLSDFLDVDGASIDAQLRHRVFNLSVGVLF